jgi:hypothetical protein
MTRFATSHDHTTKAGKTLTLMTRSELGHDLLKKVVRKDLEAALKLLESADALLRAKKHSKDLLRYAHKFFLTDEKTIAAADLTTIQTIVTKIWNGLAGDVTIKAGTNVGRNDKDVSGAVRGRETVGTARSYHNVEVDLDDNKPKTMGAIRMDQETLLDGRLGVVTLIHEASHKYAGTIDYCYLKNADQTPRGTFDDKSKALINADSYGWFVVKVGRSFTQGWLYS